MLFWENQVEVTVKDGTSSQIMTLPQGDKLTLETPSKVGYIFAGWQVNETDDFWDMEDAVENSTRLCCNLHSNSIYRLHSMETVRII